MGYSRTRLHADRASGIGIMSLLLLLGMAGDVRADIAADMTEFYVGIGMVFTFVLFVIVIFRWFASWKGRAEGTSRMAIAVVILACLLIGQAVFITIYQPWYDRVADEENAKDPFEWYVPQSPLSSESLKLEEVVVEDIDAIYVEGVPVVVYSHYKNDWCYLKVMVTSNTSGTSKGRTLDRVQSIPDSPWERNLIDGIHLTEDNGSVQCFYSSDPPGGEEGRQTRMVSSLDGLNWTNPTVVDQGPQGVHFIDLEVPRELRDFGWTDVHTSIAYDLGQGGVLIAIHYWEDGIDTEGDRGTYFAHSWDWMEWSDLVSLWEFELDYSKLSLHQVASGRYLAIEVQSNRVTITEFGIADFYDVEGPFSVR